MNKENDDFLDDLIDYYDNAEDDLAGQTTMIPTPESQTAPPEETFGDTVIVNIKQKEPEQPEDDAIDGTTVVNITEDNAELEIPEDEVLGNLDIYGNVIQKDETSVKRDINPPTPASIPAPTVEDAPMKKKNLWYSLKPLWATIILSIMLVFSYLFYVTDTGIVGIYKSNFRYNFSLIMRVFGVEYSPSSDLPVISSILPVTAYAEGDIPTTESDAKKKATIAFMGASTADFENFDNGVVCAKSNYICFIDKNGNIKWEHDTQISNPIVSTSGKYIAIASKDGTHLNLYKGEKLAFSIDTKDKIRTCSVSEKGDVAVVTDKTAYKGGVSVYNKKGEEIFSWISGTNYISSAAMLKSRNIAVSLVSTDTAVKSYVMMFDSSEKDPINRLEIPNTLAFNSEQCKNDAYICADNSILSFNHRGDLNYNIRFDNMDIAHIATDALGWRAVSYTEDYLPYINVYDKNGTLKAGCATESVPDCIDVFKSTIVYNNGRDIICGKINGEKSLYLAPMTVHNLIMIDRSTYMAVYENSLEIIKI